MTYKNLNKVKKKKNTFWKTKIHAQANLFFDKMTKN